ncbi:hypothetical protein BFW01_g10727 [Lasiodiplodia theobromae]|uniref:RNase H type-1 domain-containing protein n=1 Tax=Lasiodiplodia theobromae TaxID=45133 RepID=A0A5N5DT90_9PEZI|nr:hypothetical protein DBV05_g203 [Lasiodiplodia theobromae]KAF9629524.1 hypothetical protein BFW01_g10727 [Lasiodiplodia theobromae]
MATNGVRQPVIRIFNPEDDPSTAGTEHSDLIAYDLAHEIHHLRSRLWPIGEHDTVVVSIKGMRHSTISQRPGGAYGIYVGPKSCYNANGGLPHMTPHIERRYEMEALSRALEVLRNIVINNPDILRIFVITDSDFLSSALSEIHEVLMNAGFPQSGNRIPDFERVKQLHEHLCEFEATGRTIQFWNAPSLTRKAYELAMVT